MFSDMLQVIIGIAEEEITLERLWRDAEDEVMVIVKTYGGWQYYGEHAEEISKKFTDRLNSRPIQVKQLRQINQSLPETDMSVQKVSKFENMAEFRKGISLSASDQYFLVPLPPGVIVPPGSFDPRL